MGKEKTPFEIRLDLLHLARSVIQENKDRNFHLLMDKRSTNPDEPYKKEDIQISFEEIIEKAKELNKFVTTKQ
tara:strand:- start:201 stop:419 length:219 start_codon:yes stop_codon:yes gene_type:complete